MKTCMRAFVLALAGLAAGLAAGHAASFPQFDVDVHCTRVATFGGRFSCTLQECCLRNEQGALDEVSGVWNSVPDEIQQRCLQRADFVGESSYALLRSCVLRELEIRRAQSLHHH